ncbi:hypothetical protein TcYC6_0058880 [Trypanosoma cruzi]|nr:hypothetical protein TcYC6_0058880 [Trypanosoma cruzi]
MESIEWIHISENRLWAENLMKQLMEKDAEEIMPPKLNIWGNIHDDSVSFESYWCTLLSQKFRHPAYVAFRTSLFSALPLMYIGDRYPDIFPMHTLLALFGVAYSKDTVGEQICMICTMIPVLLWMMLWGSLMHLFNLLAHQTAWWCAVFFGAFGIGLVGDVRGRKLAILMTLIVMEVERSQLMVGKGALLPLLVGRDAFLALGFACFQSFIPPFTMCKRVDEAMAGAWVYIGEVVHNSVKACWSENPIDAAVALSKTSSEPLQKIFTTVPFELSFVHYEPWESPLRLQLRSERIKVIGGIMPMLHALVGVVRALHAAQRSRSPLDNDQSAVSPGVGVIRGRLEEALEPYLQALKVTLKQLGCVLNPREVVATVPFDDLQSATSSLQSTIDKIHYDMMKGRFGNVDPVWYMQIVFSHLMMVLIGEELLRYAEIMRNFDCSRYTSTSRRILDFFFLEHWRDFWAELPKRLTLATPNDVRLAKDAFKLACGYTLACVYTLCIDFDSVYYFGMTILMGVGLQATGDSLVAGLQRVAGLAFAAALAYVIRRHHKSDLEAYPIALVLIAVALFTSSFPAYFNCSFYCALLIPSMMHMVATPLMMFSRVVSSSLTVMTYYAIVVFVFPVDTIRVLHNSEVWVMDGISKYLSSLIRLLQAPVDDREPDVMQEIHALKACSTGLWRAVRQLPPKIKTASLEPTIRGKPYPVHEQDEFHPVLRRLLSSLDIMLLGLTILHRARLGPVADELVEMLTSSRQLLKNINLYSVYAMQDFVDAVQRPKTWSCAKTVDHFSTLLRLNAEIKKMFSMAHGKMLSAIRGKANELHLNNLKLSMVIDNNSLLSLMPWRRENSSVPRGSASICPYGEEEEGDEREELTAPRNASFMLRPEEFTINHDMNMSIAIFVGIDLFCSELVKAMRTMFYLNQFELSRRN